MSEFFECMALLGGITGTISYIVIRFLIVPWKLSVERRLTELGKGV